MSVPILNSFNSGEWSPQLDGRSDLQKYGNACRTLENFFVRPQGGAERRPGTQYIGDAKSNDYAPRLIPFVFSEGQSAVLEFGDLYMRVWRNGGQVLDEGGGVYELTTPFGIDQVWKLNFIQSADVLYLVCQAVHPQKLERNDWADWEIADLDVEYGAFKDENTDRANFIVPQFPNWATATDYVAGDIVSIDTVWSSGTTYAKDDVVYKTGDSLRFYRSRKGTNLNHDPANGSPWWEDASQKCYRALTDHTSGAGHATPPGNTTDWEEAENNLAGTTLVTLNADKDIFEEGNVGGLWLMRQPRNDNTIEFAFKSANVPESSEFINVLGTWTFVTHGNWGGLVGIERSFDNGVTWQKYRDYSAKTVNDGVGNLVGDRNVDAEGEEDKPGTLYRLASYEDADTSGTCRCDFLVRSYLTDGSIRITEFVDAKTVRGTVVMPLGSTVKTNQWGEGSWCAKNGYPGCVAIFEERLVMAGSVKEPQTIWFSRSNDYQDLTPGDFATAAMTYTIASDRIDAIKWIIAKEVLLIGTGGGEYRFGASKIQDALTPTNISCRRQTTHGAGDVHAILANDAALFWTEHNKELRELAYAFDKDQYLGPSLTLLAEHVTGDDGVKQIAYQRHPYPVLWCVRRDGEMCCLTYNREEEVVGWSRMTTTGAFESVAVISGENEDEVWVVAKRTLSTGDKRYVERFAERDFRGIVEDCKYLDSHLAEALDDVEIVRMYSGYGLEEDAAGGYVCGLFKDYQGLVDWPASIESMTFLVVDHGGTKDLHIIAPDGDVLGKAYITRTGFLDVRNAVGSWTHQNTLYCNNHDTVQVGMTWTVRKVLAVQLATSFAATNGRFSDFDVTTALEGQTRRLVQCPGNPFVYYVLSAGGVCVPESEHPEFDTTVVATKTNTTVYTYGSGTVDAFLPRLVAAYKFEDNTHKGYNFANTLTNELTASSAAASLVAGKSGNALQMANAEGTLARNVDYPFSWDKLCLNDGERMLVNFWIKVPAATTTPWGHLLRFGYGNNETGNIFFAIRHQMYFGRLRLIVEIKNSEGSNSQGYVLDSAAAAGWHMVSIVVEPSSHKISGYLDSAFSAEWTEWDGTMYSSLLNRTLAHLRYWPNSTGPIYRAELTIDELSIFKPDVEVVQDDIDALYNSGAGSFITSSPTWEITIAESTYTAGGDVVLGVTTANGLSHLEGLTVEALTDGAAHEEMVVASGGVTLNGSYSKICVGLPYTSTLQTMRIEGEVADGGSHPRKKRICEVNVRFLDTVNGHLVSPEGDIDRIYFRNTRDAMTHRLPLFFGDKKVKFSTGFNKDMTVKVVQDTPLPMTVLLMAPKMRVEE